MNAGLHQNKLRSQAIGGLLLTYFPDLSPYRYHSFQPKPDPKQLNVGWLGPLVPFPKGPVSQSIVTKLLRLCHKRVSLCRGLHRRPFGTLESPASSCAYPVHMYSEHIEVTVANSEIRVAGKNKVVHAAPTLICHYVENHYDALQWNFSMQSRSYE